MTTCCYHLMDIYCTIWSSIFEGNLNTEESIQSKSTEIYFRFSVPCRFNCCSLSFVFWGQSWSNTESDIYLLIFISQWELKSALLTSLTPLKTMRINKCILMELFFTIMLLPSCICSMIQKDSEVNHFLNALRYSNIMLCLTGKWQVDRHEKKNGSFGRFKCSEMCLLTRKVKGW